MSAPLANKIASGIVRNSLSVHAVGLKSAPITAQCGSPGDVRAMELGTSFVRTAVSSVSSSISNLGSLRPASYDSRALRRVPCTCLGQERNGKEKPASFCSRRQLILLAHGMVAAAGMSVVSLDYALAGTEKVTIYSNIDDARRAGEKLREEKEATEGPVRVSSSGIKYRELELGTGRSVAPSDMVSIYYTISRLNGYYLDSMGYGKEGKNDVGEALKFQYGKGLVPEAIDGGMEGMREGGRRRILVTPERGWVSKDLLPKPTSFFAERRLSERVTSQAVLIEIELVKVKPTIA